MDRRERFGRYLENGVGEILIYLRYGNIVTLELLYFLLQG